MEQEWKGWGLCQGRRKNEVGENRYIFKYPMLLFPPLSLLSLELEIGEAVYSRVKE